MTRVWNKISHAELATVFVILNLIDTILSRRLLASGAGREGNPILMFLSIKELTLWKIFVPLAVAAMLLILALSYPNIIKRVLAILCICMIAVCAYNGSLLWR